MDVVDLPYRAEYAKSSRASCRGCKSSIAKDCLRLAVLVQSSMFDGKMAQWYHSSCFFNKQKPKSTDDIEHFESLRIEDQKRIEEKVRNNSSSIIVPDKKGKGVKRDADAMKVKKAALKDFTIEYAKSGRAVCRGCEQKIFKDEIRISKKDYDTEIGMKYGGQDMWHHLACFAKLRSEVGYFESADKLPGFKILSKEDQKEAKKQIPPIKQEDVVVKKLKTEDTVDCGAGGSGGLSEADQKKYEEQIKLIFKYRDQLKSQCSKKELMTLLEENNQAIPVGEERMLDRLSDIMTFGALEPCNVCKHGQFVFNKQGYICQGNLTEWTKCNTIVKEPKRCPFRVPLELAAQHHFLAKYKYKPRNRVMKELHFSSDVKRIEKDEADGKPKVERKLPPLYEMEFVILGKSPRGKDQLKKQIQKLGGKVTTKISNTVMAVISNAAEIEKMNARMSEVQNCEIHVVPEEFVDEVKDKEYKDVPDLIEKSSICGWGSDPRKRLPAEPTISKSKSKSIYQSGPSKIKYLVKGGGAVDPDSGLSDIAHVYEDHKLKYNVVLSKTEIQKNQNSFYRLQLLKADKSDKYWVFRAWGRIGTTIGGTKVDNAASLHQAKKIFADLYEEKTGNLWNSGSPFRKVPGRFYPLDLEVGGENAPENLEIDDTPSSLPKPVQNLIRLLFDINAMKDTMLEFELDTEKMPLGKLSKKQLQDAYKVLNEIQDLINTQAPQARFIDATNRFYTFVPHSFGIESPPIIKDAATIKTKLDMLDNLMELEVAYNLMRSSGSQHSVDSYYNQLKTTIDVVDKTSEEYSIIEEYVRNTHAETHRAYDLEIVDVFKINRQGEDKRFKPFKKLPNHKLLWHGSRTTNFAGILSQGLRIAPPEAPVTGYMFGKGIYFADMVSKSANYCFTSTNSPTGLLLLSDVALGNMYERNNAEYITNLPKGKHSTWGIGKTEPDPSYVKEIDGAVVPIGKPVKKTIDTDLLYNEFIVYDVAQVRTKYLLRLDFKYKY